MQNRYLRKLHVELVDGDFPNPLKEQVREPQQVYEIFRAIKDKAQETLIAVYLTDRLEVVAYHVLSVGGESVSLLIPREVFGYGFVTRAYTFILLHNHPSGDATPSSEDREVMARLTKDARTLEFCFLDFIIVGGDSYWSMFDEMDGGEYVLGAAAA